MNVSIVISIAAVFIAAVPIYFLAKSNARDNEQQKKQDIADAVAPVQRALDAANARVIRLLARIDHLEDERAQGGQR